MRLMYRMPWELFIHAEGSARRRSTWNRARRPHGEVFHVEHSAAFRPAALWWASSVPASGGKTPGRKRGGPGR